MININNKMLNIIFLSVVLWLVIDIIYKSISKNYELIKVIDGDTIKVKQGKKVYVVRLIGIDCPESNTVRFGRVEKGGKEAKQFTEKLLKGKTNIRLVFDKQKNDKYGRLLAYVYANGLFVNREIVKRGYAKAVCYPPNKRYKSEFELLEAKAKVKKIGIFKR